MNASICRKVMWAGRRLAQKETEIPRLPWRECRTPYRAFLAEMLLLRTRTDVVARIFEDVYQLYPNIDALADADENRLREMLNPLGLPKRVPYIMRAARYIRDNHGGAIPSDIASLLKVPGIGAYAANAILAFAYGSPTVPADVNILRFTARLTGLEMGHATKGTAELRELALLLAEDRTGLRAEVLLDFTRLICKPRKPLCSRCLLTEHCAYHCINLVLDNHQVEPT